jgi:outer membrane protein assembly factor BamB
MISRCFLCSLLCALAFYTVCPTVGQEWCRFRGPNGTGESDAATIPSTWTAKDYNWRIALAGIGHSSPVVWGDRIFVTSAREEDGTWIVLCLRASDGSIVWKKSYPSSAYRKNRLTSYATSTPVVDKDRLYTTWGTPAAYTVLAFDQQNGGEVWRRDLGPFVAQHGFGASPILFDNLLIVPNDQDGQSFVIALDRATGETRWSVKRRATEAAYSTPIVIQPAGGPSQLILTGGTQGVSSYDPLTGNTNWELNVLKDRVVGSPTLAAGMIIAGFGEGGGGRQLFAIKPGDADKNIKPKVVHEFHGSLPYVPISVARGELLFLWSDAGVVTCADVPTGIIHWRERVGGKFFGSPIRVADRLYCMSCAGKMVVLAAAKQYELVGQIDLEEPSHSTPAVADGIMYLRTFSHLISLGGKK